MPDPATAPVALVTGGAKRIGRAVCLELAGRGMRLAIHANTSTDDAEALAQQISDNGGDARAFAADLGDESQARELVDAAHQHFGRLDALVNSAAIWAPKDFADVTADDVRHYFNVNTVSSFVCAQQAGLIMAGQAWGGAIINLGDWADGADGQPYPDHAAYHPSKAAIPATTRMLAIELASRNGRVRVNAVLPGPVLASAGETPDNRPEVYSGNLLRDPGTAEDVAAAVAFLIANPFVTGVCLPVDGGRRLAGGAG